MIRLALALAVLLTGGAGEAERRVALGRESAALERALTSLRAELRGLSIALRDLRGEAGEKSARAAALLAAEHRAASAPPAAYLMHPDGPQAGVMGAAALRAAAPQLRAKADAARARLQRIEALRAERATAEKSLRNALAALSALRAELEALPAPEADLRLTAASVTARDLAELARALPPTPDDLPAAAPPPWRWPVEGRVTLGYGAKTDHGALTGVELRAPPNALLRAPAAASLRFVGDLPGRGGVAVLEPQPGVLVTLAGLGRITAAQGATLLADEPFAAMGGDPLQPDEFLREIDGPVAGEAYHTLYIEVRRDGALENPEAWFASTDGRIGE